MMRSLLASVLVLLTIGSAQAQSTAPYTGEDIAAIVRDVLVAHGEEGVPILASQRRYFPCDVDLTVAPRREGRWDAVNVSCAGTIPWSIVVRTSAHVPVGFGLGLGDADGETTRVLVFRHTIRRGEVITADKLELVEMQSARAQGTFSEIEPLIGRRMVQTLSAGVPVRERHLEMDWAVRANDPIVIETVTGEMVIAMAGVALEDGQAGDFIRVRNLRSGRVVVGMVTKEKKIIVSPNMN
jgi:flagellar basal body P-ring formation protein FlgA